MTPDEYIEKAHRTVRDDYKFQGTDEVTARLEHAVMGIVTEAGELMDQIKKSKIYNKPIDKVNLIEEGGDVMWYLALLARELGIGFEEMWDKNIRKLQKRYPEKWSEHDADPQNRDLSKEREELEK